MSKPLRQCHLVLDPELAAAIANFMAAQDHLNLQDTVRELCRMALASDPYNGSLASARAAAFQEVRQWAKRRVAEALMDVAAELRAAGELSR